MSKNSKDEWMPACLPACLDSQNLLTSQVDFMGVITQMNITKWGQDCRKSRQSPTQTNHTKCKRAM